ncbi:hypothetical protein A9Q99_24350 [Gammaproteobacteria bacterium 45_16_T64]|nr:hypothetical protein A9Q99_24350 [Gammaproteobacteria bacterium 45_16_T64]
MMSKSVFRDDYFKERAIIVTGGVSGIGRCFAHELCSVRVDLREGLAYQLAVFCPASSSSALAG